MPKIKFKPGKVVVCCGDHDCVEIDTSDQDSSPDEDGTPPESPISGGLAIFAPRTMTERLTLRSNTPPHEFLAAQVDRIQKSFLSIPHDNDLHFSVQLTVPPGSRLRSRKLQALAKRMNAEVEIHFSRQE